MTRLLVSVRNAAEAQAALDGRADLIDVKEPARGSLGAADAEQIAAVLELVGSRVPVSVALGELADHRMGVQSVFAGNAPLPSYAKLGLAGCADWPAWPQRWAEAVSEIPPAVQRVAVAYADWQAARAPDPWQVLRHAIVLDCRAILVDTHSKSHGWLLSCWPTASLAEFIEGVWSAGMLAVLGGSLSPATLADVLALQPDYIAVRGAVCQGGRTGSLDAGLVRSLTRILHAAAES